MRAIVFANGVMNPLPGHFVVSAPTDLLVAADGGLRHCLDLGLTPHVIVGDLDSVQAADLEGFAGRPVEILRFDRHKDETDLELALKAAVDRGAKEICILGAMGARWDMTLGNVLVMAAPFLDDVDVRIVDGPQEIRCLRGGKKLRLAGGAGDRLSLIPLGAAAGITLRGFAYPLHGATMDLGSTRGLSNEFLDISAEVELAQGFLLVVTIARQPDTGRIR